MTTILDQIVVSKRREIAEAQVRRPLANLEARLKEAPVTRDFRAALEAAPSMAVIAEVKKASPSAGLLRSDFDPAAIAGIYEKHGASCISVLTDRPFFQGQLDDLRAVRSVVGIPVLRKDFILDRYQVLEARVAGADAVLLIAEILDEGCMRSLLADIHQMGMQALVEFYDAENLTRVVDSGARLIGINNRDLRSFVTRLEHTLELAPRLPPGCCLVSESGIKTQGDLVRLRAAGVRAVLVGETLMRAEDIGSRLTALLEPEK